MNGPIGVLLAWANFLHQVDLVSQIVSSFLLYPRPLQFLFDTILENEGFDDVVVRGKYIKLNIDYQLSQMDQFKKWLLDLPSNMVLYPLFALNLVLNIALTFVPIVGPILLVFINAPSRGFNFHKRYYELKGINNMREQKLCYNEQKWDYILFGLSTGVLSQIPFLSTLFQFTSVTGAALWAIELEVELKRKRDGMVENYKQFYN